MDGSGKGLERGEMGRPVVGEGEVLVKVRAAGVTFAELQWWPTLHTKEGKERKGAVVGHEFSGTVVEVGKGADLKVGEEVFGMNDWFAEGATAEFVAAKGEWVARRMEGLPAVEAGGLPIVGLTAWQGLVEKAKLSKGETVLIHGGSGAVGCFAIQLARRAGARVMTTASGTQRDFLMGLGAERVIDYKTERFEEIVKDVDVVFDGVGGETLRRSWGMVREGGRVVTISSEQEGEMDERTKKAFFLVEAKRGQLEEVGRLVAKGEVKLVMDVVVEFEQAGEAYAKRVRGSGRGKVVVEVGV